MQESCKRNARKLQEKSMKVAREMQESWKKNAKKLPEKCKRGGRKCKKVARKMQERSKKNAKKISRKMQERSKKNAKKLDFKDGHWISFLTNSFVEGYEHWPVVHIRGTRSEVRTTGRAIIRGRVAEGAAGGRVPTQLRRIPDRDSIGPADRGNPRSGQPSEQQR